MNSKLSAFSLSDFANLWEHEFTNDSVDPDSEPTIHQEVVYQASEAAVHAIDINDGSQLWQYNFEESNSSEMTPTVDSSGVYINTAGRLIALDSDGNQMWSESSANGYSSFVSIDDQNIFVTGFDTGEDPSSILRKGICIGKSGGEVNWSTRIEGRLAFQARNLANDESTVYVSTSENLYSLSISDGTKNWEQPLRIDGEYPIPVATSITEQTVYTAVTANSRGEVVAFDSDSGTELWRQDFDRPIMSEPVIHRGRVFIGTGGDLNIIRGNQDRTPVSTSSPTQSVPRDDTGASGSTSQSDDRETSSLSVTSTQTQRNTLEQQQGTANTTQEVSDPSSGIAAFTQFGASGRSIGLGGLIAALGIGGGYTAYRRFTGNDDNSEE
jgi:outer membrane protein assembly factor BamB